MMEAIEEFRRKLEAGAICLGVGITFTDPLVTDAVAGSADFVFIDTEHSGLCSEAVLRHVLAARGRNTPALVRVAHGSAPFIKPVLDGGADGIVVPQVRTADEVRQAVSACRYPPEGSRGFGPRVPSDYGREGGRAFLDRANTRVFVSVQIETAEALRDIDALVAVPGLDAVFIGPFDLAGALGMPGDVAHAKVMQAIDRIVERSRAAGVFVGAGMRTDPEYACDMARRGVQWMQIGSDFGFLVRGMERIAAGIRSGLAETEDRGT